MHFFISFYLVQAYSPLLFANDLVTVSTGTNFTY